MKTLKLLSILLILFVSSSIRAQVSVNLQIGSPPVWGPVVTTQEYYYLPDINSYYDIRQSQFIYLNNGTWVRAGSLPGRYRSYNLNTGNVVVINDYHGRSPYTYYKSHKVKYHKQDNNWERNRGNDEHHEKGHGNGNGKGKGKH